MRIPSLYPGEKFLTVASDIAESHFEVECAEWIACDFVPREGAPWNGDDSFTAYQRHLMQQLAGQSGIPAADLMRFMGRKPCLSCGVYQSNDGTLPCGH